MATFLGEAGTNRAHSKESDKLNELKMTPLNASLVIRFNAGL